MKMVGKMAWFRPADTVLRVPFTPRLRAVVEEEASRLGLKLKVVKRSGVPLKRQITTPGALGWPPNLHLQVGADGVGQLHHQVGSPLVRLPLHVLCHQLLHHIVFASDHPSC